MNNEERIVALLAELVAWTRFSARESLISLLHQVLTDPKHLKAYELTDGTRKQKEVGDAVGLTQPSISKLYGKWRRLGIVRETNGEVAHLIRPSDLGLESEEPAPARERSQRHESHSDEESSSG